MHQSGLAGGAAPAECPRKVAVRCRTQCGTLALASHPPADMDFAYVHDAKLVKECGGDCKSPFVIMYKQGESESPR